jgi:anti-anti-sigma regulatory factor
MAAANVPVKVLTWEGSPSVEQAAALKAELLAALAHADQVVVSVSLLDGMDVSIMQLLRSAALEAAALGKAFHLTGTIKPELARAWRVAGLLRSAGDNARTLEAELLGYATEAAV